MAKVRPARVEDAAWCAEITATGRNAEAFAQAIRGDLEAWVVLEDDAGQPIGVAGCQLWRWNRAAWVMDLSIRRDRRGHGQGRILLDALLDAARGLGALVLLDFEPQGGQLIEFYLQNGFRICGFCDRYLPGTEDPSVVFLSCDL
ncbi:MAG TPA: hypothetical protein DCZ72_05845 [Armatimonadetes bacterium]|nr:hypothetical protein [Armatimonadota bacterium]